MAQISTLSWHRPVYALTPHLETAFHKPFSAQEMMRATVEVATQYVAAVDDGNNSRNKRPAEDAVHKEEDEEMGQDAAEAEAKRRKAEGAAAA